MKCQFSLIINQSAISSDKLKIQSHIVFMYADSCLEGLYFNFIVAVNFPSI